MNIEDFREYCLSKNGVTEELPFGPDTLVYKIGGKIFALTGLDSEIFSINLKVEPEKAILQRDEFDFIKPGYHMNKKHWNTVTATTGISDKFLKELIDDSFNLVFQSLPKSIKSSLIG